MIETAASFRTDARLVVDALADYLRESAAGQGPVIRQRPLGAIVRELDLAGLARRGGLGGAALASFLAQYLADSTRLHHPAYMAHQVATPHPAGSLAALVDALTNNPMAIYEMGPAAAAVEFFVVNWLLQKVGWTPAPFPEEGAAPAGGGVLTHGGSLANLTALTAARTRLVPDVWEKGLPGDLALLAAPGCHYSIARAAGILGIGAENVFPLPADRDGVVLPAALPEALGRVRAAGKRVVALVANACSTAAGLYDPLVPIGAFCAAEGLWFHVDGAHGAGALLSGKYRHLLAGIEGADSLVWDAHKLLRTPTLCAAVLVRRAETLDGAFHEEASYLFHAKEQPGVDFVHRTVECTKAALGLRFFLVLAALGEEGLAAYVESRYDLARSAHAYFAEQDDFETAVAPQSNILCFRRRGPDALQLRLRAELTAGGRYYVSSTEYRGRRWLRLALMNPETTLEEIQGLAEEIRRLASRAKG